MPDADNPDKVTTVCLSTYAISEVYSELDLLC